MTACTPNLDASAPQIERSAVALFERIGRACVVARHADICAEADRRFAESYRQHGTMPAGFTAINFLLPEERAERHLLEQALTLCVDDRAEASARLAKRIAGRRGIQARSTA